MKQIYEIKIKVRLSVIISILLFIAVVVAGLYYYNNSSTKTGLLAGSLAAGLVVALIQWIISWKEYSLIEKIEDLELVKILYNRDDRTYYEDLIRNSKKSIKVMGVTAKRFFEHFADTNNGAPDKARVLLVAMERGVDVQILLPHENFLPEEKKNAHHQVMHVLREIQHKNYTGKIDIRYFQHAPAHSIFMVDNTCIVGPVFEKVESKYTPALHLKNESPFAEKYIAYFEQEWKKLDA